MRASLLVVTLLLASCGSSDPADFAGTFTLAITNKANGCGFMNWTEGSSTSDIGFTITQQDTTAMGQLNGVVGTYVTALVGTNSWTGSVDGASLTLTLNGTKSYMKSACTYQIISKVHGGLDGDLLSGTIDYTTATNGSPDCGTLQGCHSTQNFNGTRPPR